MAGSDRTDWASTGIEAAAFRMSAERRAKRKSASTNAAEAATAMRPSPEPAVAGGEPYAGGEGA